MADGSRCFLLLLLCCSTLLAQSPAHQSFRSLHVDAGKVIGEIRSLQGLNGPPTPVMAGLPNLIRQYRELRVDQVRTHDFMGPTEIDSKFEYGNKNLTSLIPDPTQRAGVVRAGNKNIIFPDASADPEKPESYNFGPTDKMLAAIQDSGAEIYYRIGRSWGANIDPPVDSNKFADVAKHLVMHYNHGWANGFHYHIRYWEIWNEPDGVFWSGTPEQFYSLYAKTARALKSVDPTLKVGASGIAWADKPGPYREGFLDYCAAHKTPLDFFSWHSYTNVSTDPYDPAQFARRIREVLDAHGFPGAESILSEWNLSADFTEKEKAELRSVHNAAYIGAALSYFQDAPIDHAHFYRGDAAWMGLFDMQGRYFKTAYAFKAMGIMLDTPLRLAVEGTDTRGFAALAGRSADGEKVQIFITNYVIPAKRAQTPDNQPYQVQASAGSPSEATSKLRKDIANGNARYNLLVSNLPWGKKAFTIKRYRISATRNLDLVEERSDRGDSLNLSHPLAKDTIDLIVLERK